MKHFIIGVLAITALLSIAPRVNAQKSIPTSKTFLKANLDARSTSLAGAGAATTSDSYAIYTNASKAILGEQKMAIGLSYTPWRPKLDDGFRLFSMAGYYNVDKKHSILLGTRYFTNVGPKVNYGNTAEFSPYDYSVDFGYGARLLPNWSLSVVGSYAYSYFDSESKSRDLCMSLSSTYRHIISDNIGWTTALNIANIGLKNFDDSKYRNRVPTTFTWGNAMDFKLAPKHMLAATIDAIGYQKSGDSKALNNMVAAMGVEYDFSNMVFLRAGYRFAISDKDKGNYSYFTSGLGVKYKFISLDGAYIIAAKNTPMQDAWWLTAAFGF